MVVMLRILRKQWFALMLLSSVIFMSYTITFNGFHIKISQTEAKKYEPGGSSLTDTVNAETNVTKRFSERRSSVKKKCASAELTRGHVLGMTGYAPAKLTMCNVPKAACTIWLRLFSYLINKESSNRTITSLSKYDVHVTTRESRERYDFEGEDRKYIMKSVRVMTTRDPYTRLWSVYIDKFLLPDFWEGRGVEIIKMTRRNATGVAKRCGNDVTFPEFIQYALNVGHSLENWGFNFHWLPVTDICDPCMFEPDYIMKHETFLSDFTRVMDQVGLFNDVKPILEVSQDEYGIESEIDYNFRLYKQSSICVTKLQLSKIIWKAMKLNGYLQPDDEFPAHLTEEKINKSTIVGFVQAARKRNDSIKQTKKAIRKQALSDAYRQLSKNQLTALQELYKVDFEMFDYDSSPPV